MNQWKLKSYTLPDGKTTIVNKWFKEQSASVKAAFLNRMNALVKLSENGWDRPDVGQLRGKECKGLFEIVIFADNVQHRPIGYFSGKCEFTFVVFAVEKGGKLTPPNICKTAKERIKIIEDKKENINRVREFTLIKK